MPFLDFPCSRTFRQWEAEREGLSLPDIDTRSAWGRDYDARHHTEGDITSWPAFLALCEPAMPIPQKQTPKVAASLPISVPLTISPIPLLRLPPIKREEPKFGGKPK